MVEQRVPETEETGRMDSKEFSGVSKELKDIKIGEDEVLVSFDIESYFPSVPVPESIEMIEAWLDTQPSVNHLIREAYVDLT